MRPAHPSLRPLQPRRDVAFAVQDTPDVHAVSKIGVGHDVRERGYRTTSKHGQVQFVAVPLRPGSGMRSHMRERAFDRVDERRPGRYATRAGMVLNRLLDIAARLLAQHDRLAAHLRAVGVRPVESLAARRARLRSCE